MTFQEAKAKADEFNSEHGGIGYWVAILSSGVLNNNVNAEYIYDCLNNSASITEIMKTEYCKNYSDIKHYNDFEVFIAEKQLILDFPRKKSKLLKAKKLSVWEKNMKN